MLTSLAKLSVGVFSLGVQRLTCKRETQTSISRIKGGKFFVCYILHILRVMMMQITQEINEIFSFE